jgi:pyrimidine operon attenuation protein/uracil phosphoribosyltransferase
LIRALSFASCYVYSPGGNCSVSRRSRLLCALLKAGDADFLSRYAERVRREVTEHQAFSGIFGETTILIPVPRSAPAPSRDLWIAEHLAAAFVEEGLGGFAWTGLKRVRAVRKSATAPVGRRPTVVTHYESFMIEGSLPAPERIVLVDDVITRGRTLLAAATRVHEAFPNARIRAFALLRTMGLVPEIGQLLDPCVGEIRWRGGDAHRNP